VGYPYPHREKLVLTAVYGRSKSILVLVVGMVTVSLFVFISFLLYSRVPAPPPVSNPVEPHEKIIATHLRIDDYRNGGRTVYIEIDQLSVVHKKMGFFRLGFMKTARMEHTRIDFYEPSSTLKTQKNTPVTGLGSDRLTNQLSWLKHYLPGNITGIEMIDVRFSFLKTSGNPTCSISAEKAWAGMQASKIIFTGNVKVVTNSGAEMSGQKIVWLTDTGKLTTDRSYIIKKGGQEMRGQGLETDFALSTIEF
jgi:hypothetical protein